MIYALDVAGHGSQAALLAMRSHNPKNTDFREPAEVLAALNTLFPMGADGSNYFTFWYGVYNRSTYKLAYSCGGYTPAVLFGPDPQNGQKRPLHKAGGMPIGMVVNAHFDSEVLNISPGSSLYLFSNGAYEAISKAKNGGLKAFLEMLDAHHCAQADDLSPILQQIQSVESESTLADDFALVKIVFEPHVDLSEVDPLTQIASHAKFEDYLESQWHQMKRQRHSLSLILIDLDNFTIYNHFHGKATGNQFLQKAAKTLQIILKRKPDLLTRYKGDIFAAILPQTDLEGVQIIANKMVKSIETLGKSQPGPASHISISANAGIATIKPNPKNKPQDLLLTAQKSLKRLKQNYGPPTAQPFHRLP